MVINIGTDIVEINRVKKLIEKYGDHFLERTFTPKEIVYCSKKVKAESFAVRIAAKEALFKAAGTGWRDGLRWKDFEILNDELGKPYVNVYGKAREIFRECTIHISLSHNRTQALAVVVIEK